MNIIAYTYEADYHCIDCTQTRFLWAWNNPELTCKLTEHCHWISHTHEVDYHGIGYEVSDNEGNLVNPVFNTDEWQELDEGFIEENPTQFMACGDCHEVIDSYAV
jgi:hypothetical protein